MNVYILYHYGEHGAEDAMATLDRRDLIGMLERHQKRLEQLPEEDQYGVGDGPWTRISGWSDRVVDWMRLEEETRQTTAEEQA